MGKRLSVEFFVCSALLLVFGAGFSSMYGSSVGLALFMSASVIGAGLYLRTEADAARLVGLGVMAVVVAIGGYSTFTGRYMPGTVIALITLVRMVSSGAMSGSSAAGGAAAGTRPVAGQPYPAFAPPQPFAAPTGGPARAQPYLGDPRFGPPQMFPPPQGYPPPVAYPCADPAPLPVAPAPTQSWQPPTAPPAG